MPATVSRLADARPRRAQKRPSSPATIVEMPRPRQEAVNLLWELVDTFLQDLDQVLEGSEMEVWVSKSEEWVIIAVSHGHKFLVRVAAGALPDQLEPVFYVRWGRNEETEMYETDELSFLMNEVMRGLAMCRTLAEPGGECRPPAKPGA